MQFTMTKPAVLLALLLSACASTPQEQATDRFAVCMKQTVGPFGVFASPESRRRAAETCKAVMAEPAPKEKS